MHTSYILSSTNTPWKKAIIFVALVPGWVSVGLVRKWKNLNVEQQWAKVKLFRKDSWKFMQAAMKLTEQQVKNAVAANT